MDPQLQTQCAQFLEKLRASPAAWPFLSPVDWKAMGLNDYPLVVTQPMDLKTVGRKLKSKRYQTVAQFLDDIYLIWGNCKTFNTEAAEVYQHATAMQNLCNKLKQGLTLAASDSTMHRRSSSEAQSLASKQRTQTSGSSRGGSATTVIESVSADSNKVPLPVEPPPPQAKKKTLAQPDSTSPGTAAAERSDEERVRAITEVLRELESLTSEGLTTCLTWVAASEAGDAVLHWTSAPEGVVGDSEAIAEDDNCFDHRVARSNLRPRQDDIPTIVVTFHFDVSALYDLFPIVFGALCDLLETTVEESPNRGGLTKSELPKHDNINSRIS